MVSNEDASYTSIGIVIAIIGNILISLALNIQKVAHKHLHRASNSPPALSRHASAPDSHDFLESRPLLPRTASSPGPEQSYGATRSKRLFNMPRIRFIQKQPAPTLETPPLSPQSTHEDLEHDRDDDELDERAQAAESDYLRSKLWWFGFLLMNVGEIGNFLRSGPRTLVACS